MTSHLTLHARALRRIARRLKCDSVEDLPNAAERFLLGDESPEVTGAEEVDRRLEHALNRFSIDVERLHAGDQAYRGRLLVTEGGFRLRIRGDMSQTAFRFVLAHELAHTLAYDNSGREPVRLRLNDAAEEKLCNIIARRLLLPGFLLSERIDGVLVGKKISVEVLDGIAAEYAVAPWQVLVRALEESGRVDVVAIVWTGYSSGLLDEGQRRSLRVLDSFSPLGMFIPNRDRSFDGESEMQLVWQLLRSGQATIAGQDVFAVGTLQGKLDSVCVAPLTRPEHLLQLAFLDDMHLKKATQWRRTHGVE